MIGTALFSRMKPHTNYFVALSEDGQKMPKVKKSYPKKPAKDLYVGGI
jgi:hypothetical protein